MPKTVATQKPPLPMTYKATVNLADRLTHRCRAHQRSRITLASFSTLIASGSWEWNPIISTLNPKTSTPHSNPFPDLFDKPLAAVHILGSGFEHYFIVREFCLMLCPSRVSLAHIGRIFAPRQQPLPVSFPIKIHPTPSISISSEISPTQFRSTTFPWIGPGV